MVTAQAAEADRGVLAQLVADAQPYLVVRASDLGAIVGAVGGAWQNALPPVRGPLPRHVDPVWPRPLAQLCRGRVHRLSDHAGLGRQYRGAACAELDRGLLPDLIAGVELAADRQMRQTHTRAPGLRLSRLRLNRRGGWSRLAQWGVWQAPTIQTSRAGGRPRHRWPGRPACCSCRWGRSAAGGRVRAQAVGCRRRSG